MRRRLLVLTGILGVAAAFICGGLAWRFWPAGRGPVALRTVNFSDLPGFSAEEARAAFVVFRKGCGGRHDPHLDRVCAETRNAPPDLDALAFFTTRFIPREIGSRAFFTGYYEPVVAGSLVSTGVYKTPLLGRPDGLIAMKPGSVAGLDPALSAALRSSDGRLSAVPARGAIEDGALGDAARPVLYVESPVEAFFIQVQGSARVRLPDGSLRRVVFAGRNGHPYTAIGKVLAERLHVPPAEMTMATLKSWIAAHGQGPEDSGGKLMRENRSFIFFRLDDNAPDDEGPPGAAQVRLTPLRSLAVDHTIWGYGLPFYVDTSFPNGAPLRRLMVAQDTGAAIRGPARADLFIGTGADAAQTAGALRQDGRLIVLWPRGEGL